MNIPPRHDLSRSRPPLALTLFGLALLAIGAPALLAEDFTVDPKASRITVAVEATGHDFVGVLSEFDAEISGNAQRLAPTRVVIRWDFADLDTDNSKRNRKMLAWLEHGKFPEGSFEMTKWVTDEKGQTFAEGELTIHGVAKTLRFPCRLTREKDLIRAEGRATFSYEDFSLPIIRTMALLTVKPELRVEFVLVGRVDP